MTFRLIVGDCVQEMQNLEANSIDSIVCDPPYGLEFMGKEWDRLGDVGKSSHQGFDEEPGFKGFRLASYSASSNVKCQRCQRWKWDHEGRKCECGPDAIWPNVAAHQGRLQQAWHHAWATEALRVLKPGGHLLAFGGTRTYHRLACALEDAGFEIRDCLAWLYGSGFPKSLDVSKAIDKAAGAEREVVGTRDNGAGNGSVVGLGSEPSMSSTVAITAPATPEAQRWQGWGTALKPAHEPIVLARKPLAGTVAQNVLEHGTGALNVDGCRIETDEAWSNGVGSDFAGDGGWKDAPRESNPAGRWPANVILDTEAAAMLDEQTGERPTGALTPYREQHVNATSYRLERDKTFEKAADTGGASRFFYVPKADREERNRGLEHMAPQFAPTMNDGIGGREHSPDDPRSYRGNHHPTVKPVALMQWLVRLITPPGGTVLDPFTGSGTTGIAALREGFEFIGIEREPEYVEIARVRILGDAPLFNQEVTA